MKQKSTIKPFLLPTKALYEDLTTEEEAILESQTDEFLEHETKLATVLQHLPKKEMKPSRTSVNIILQYSKKKSTLDPIY